MGVFTNLLKRFTYTPTNRGLEDSDSEDEHRQKKKRQKLNDQAPPLPSTLVLTSQEAAVASPKVDSIARAIEARGSISSVEYEYYNKLLRERVVSDGQVSYSSLSMLKPTPVHPLNTSPASVVHSFLNRGQQTAESPLSLSKALKRSRTPENPNSMQEDNGKDEEPLFLDRRTPPKRRHPTNVVGASETAIRIMEKLDQITPLEVIKSTHDHPSDYIKEARAAVRLPPTYSSRVPTAGRSPAVAELAPRKMDKVKSTPPSRGTLTVKPTKMDEEYDVPSVPLNTSFDRPMKRLEEEEDNMSTTSGSHLAAISASPTVSAFTVVQEKKVAKKSSKPQEKPKKVEEPMKQEPQEQKKPKKPTKKPKQQEKPKKVEEPEEVEEVEEQTEEEEEEKLTTKKPEQSKKRRESEKKVTVTQLPPPLIFSNTVTVPTLILYVIDTE